MSINQLRGYTAHVLYNTIFSIVSFRPHKWQMTKAHTHTQERPKVSAGLEIGVMS